MSQRGVFSLVCISYNIRPKGGVNNRKQNLHTFIWHSINTNISPIDIPFQWNLFQVFFQKHFTFWTVSLISKFKQDLVLPVKLQLTLNDPGRGVLRTLIKANRSMLLNQKRHKSPVLKFFIIFSSTLRSL